ncbi:hypothetical protein P170DRAFT_446099 [Aspergillus steynii IBT 23096]|uniref:Zn(2)-C6 fungal-type domain-containing protein n=1 Tax=Aspergillus steynii IBT 23096 TaxID=1392250 RepID=A0A2I2GDK6_9EURO|nr:uncharacterized protein P170DRAFT_446099 [Aspergillus steynii IBT 23096]PLB50897.1 hypothetical protein P170DRAFT_446099 [Aspergillus steynii IBT 23096]
MVYDGRPSKGCGNCRARKVRCDQTRPACRECIRLNRECPGYRDELTVMFRDESESVKRKARSSKSSSTSASSASKRQTRPGRAAFQIMASSSTGGSSISFEDAVFDSGSDSGPRFLTSQLRQSPLGTRPSSGLSKEEAICFFLKSHTFPGTSLMTDALTKFLMHSGGSLSQRAIHASILAVATAMISRVHNVRSLRQSARHEYGTAILRVNEALADADEAKTNQTLGAVIFLSLYELVVSRAPQCTERWTNHISGAAALLEYRGFGQLRNEAGVRLFLHLRYQIIMSCLQRDVRVPGTLLETTKLDLFPQAQEALGNKLILIIGRLSNLRADILAKAIDNSEEILREACSIEADLVAWLVALPPEFTYSSHTLMPMDRVFERRCRGVRPLNNEYHLYPDIWAPSCWNHYRCARILASELILSHAHKLSNSSSDLLSEDFRIHCKSLRSTIRRLGVDICRSVPFHLGVFSSDAVPDAPMLPPESYLGGLMLLWPLFVAGMVEGPTHPQRRWVIQCLQTIGHSCGLDQALAVMDLLRVDPGIFCSVEITLGCSVSNPKITLSI